MAARVPVDLYDRESLVIRTRDVASRWANPSRELSRLAAAGIVRPLSPGYWLVPPADRLTDPAWRPEVEALALAVGVADYGRDAVALMGVSAARRHGALPRALARAVLAVPRQRPPLQAFGEILFVKRDTGRLATEAATTPLSAGQVTTVEQTLLDLADRPGLGGVDPRQLGEAMSALAVRADWDEVMSLARTQHLHAGYVRARWVAMTTGAATDTLAAWPPRRPVASFDLVAPGPDDTAFGIGHDARP
jgi:predicted transcriptional regulator of viral defense system